mmetsp:Transcript_55802/g.102359  ORF Transcript_55802/g.102359 Transcript_55802/m.102359 type:complete len:226 (+) Transcript_55802:1263-1940(+)
MVYLPRQTEVVRRSPADAAMPMPAAEREERPVRNLKQSLHPQLVLLGEEAGLLKARAHEPKVGEEAGLLGEWLPQANPPQIMLQADLPDKPERGAPEKGLRELAEVLQARAEQLKQAHPGMLRAGAGMPLARAALFHVLPVLPRVRPEWLRVAEGPLKAKLQAILAAVGLQRAKATAAILALVAKHRALVGRSQEKLEQRTSVNSSQQVDRTAMCSMRRRTRDQQ